MAAMIPPRELGRYSGIFGAVFAVATVAGPLIGGVLVDTSWLGWRWCFFIGVPFALAAIALLQRTLHLPTVRREVRIDWLGAFLIIAGVCALLIWSTLAGNSFDWASWQTAALVDRRGGAAGGGRLGRVPGRRADHPAGHLPQPHGHADHPRERPGRCRRCSAGPSSCRSTSRSRWASRRPSPG